MARKIHRRNHFVIDRLLDANDKAQDHIDDITLKRYEDYRAYDRHKKRGEKSRERSVQMEKKFEEIADKIKALNRQLEDLLIEVGEIKEQQ